MVRLIIYDEEEYMKKYTKILCLILSFIFLINTTTYAAETKNISTQKDIEVPIKYICESLGGTVSWNGDDRTALIKYKNKTLQIKIDSNDIVIDGKTVTIKDKVKSIKGRILLPISVLNQYLDLKLTNDECLKIIGITFIDLLKKNKIDDCSGLLSDPFSIYLSSKSLLQIKDFLSSVILDNENVSLTKNTVHQSLSFPFTISQKKYNYVIKFDYDSKIDELSSIAVQPYVSYSKPSYEEADKFTEEEVTIGKGAWKLPATLTVPKGKGTFPVIILVHDAGPNDRDESLGALKPFRDLSVGLASNNVAVLRYEKRTLEHATKMALIGNVTLNEETEQDVFAAAAYLKNCDKIDSSNIVLLGHGIGGYALPKIMNADTSDVFKAGIVMSGYSRSLYEVLPEQLEYFVTRGLADESMLRNIKAQIKILDDASFDPTKPPENYTLGDAYFYSYMKTYDVLGEAKALDKPMLVLQGERDYLVNSKIDFGRWGTALSGNKEAEFKLYTKLNHLYTEGEDDFLPNEYFISANIPKYVIDDILNFVNKTTGK